MKLSSAYSLHVLDERPTLIAVYKGFGRDSWLHVHAYIVCGCIGSAGQWMSHGIDRRYSTRLAHHLLLLTGDLDTPTTLKLGKPATQVTALSCTLVG
jgi:hypothetical protein